MKQNYTIVQPYQGSVIVKTDDGKYKLLKRDTLSLGFSDIKALTSANKNGKAFTKENDVEEKIDGKRTREVARQTITSDTDNGGTVEAGEAPELMVAETTKKATTVTKKKRTTRKSSSKK